MVKFFRGERGFTLIELLVVIAVIGVLAAGLLVIINPVAQMQKARDATRRSDANQLVSAIKRYYIANGKYPDVLTTNDWFCSINGSNWMSELANSGEVEKLPKDPINTYPSGGTQLLYYYTSNGTDYCLQIGLEINPGNDPNCIGDCKTASNNSWKLRYGPSLPHAVGSLCLTR